jgi:hypothetical protein
MCARSGCSNLPQARWRGLRNSVFRVWCCVRGHQKSNLKLRSENRSVANAPKEPILALLYICYFSKFKFSIYNLLDTIRYGATITYETTIPICIHYTDISLIV